MLKILGAKLYLFYWDLVVYLWQVWLADVMMASQIQGNSNRKGFNSR